MSNVVDVPRLIAEVQKRSAIWDGRIKARQHLPKLWEEVAANVGADGMLLFSSILLFFNWTKI